VNVLCPFCADVFHGDALYGHLAEPDTDCHEALETALAGAVDRYEGP
jgi:hypothetical protein